jgi:hypothetical protein
MKLSELLEHLEDKVDEYGCAGIEADQIEVIVVSQPSYPLNNHIGVVATDHELAEYEERHVESGEPKNIVWIGVDQVSGYDTEFNCYGPRALWEMR